MDNIENVTRDLERPPSKNNLSIANIIQLLFMLFVGYEAGKGLFDLFKAGRFSIIDLIKIIIDLLVLVGFVLSGYGLFTDKSDTMKTGFVLFFYGMLAVMIIFIVDWFRGGFGFGSLSEFILYAILTYVIFIQIPHI